MRHNLQCATLQRRTKYELKVVFRWNGGVQSDLRKRSRLRNGRSLEEVI